jgi:hypothetical protein
VASRSEMLGDGTIRGEEPLRLPGRLGPLHPPLPLAGGLMGVLRAVIEIPVLAVLHARQYLPLGRTIAFELVRDDHPRNILAALEQLAEELLGRVRVTPTLDPDIQDMIVLIQRPPPIVVCATNRQEYLIQVPPISTLRPSVSKLIGICLAKLTAPLADRFIRHNDATGEEEFFEVAVAETKAEIEPDAMADDLGQETVVLVMVR